MAGGGARPTAPRFPSGPLSKFCRLSPEADIADLKPVEQHLADVLSLGPLVPAPEPMAATAAIGLRVAADLYAPADLPAFASSALDGYAVRTADVPGRLVVSGVVAAGTVPTATVTAGRAVRIMTGSALPEGTEAVIGIEHTDGGIEAVEVFDPVSAGAALRPAGSDVSAGDLVLAAGQRIGPAQLAALLSTGHLQVEVWRRPRVLVVSTGDELIEAGQQPGPAQLIDSNRPALLAAVAAAGAEAIDGGLAADDPAPLLDRLTGHDADLVLTSGGVSMGAFDVVKLALREHGVHFDRVAMQPGLPQAWGRLPRAGGSVAFVGLPGNPVSALVSFVLFIRPLLGRPARLRPRRLAQPITGSPAGKSQYLRGRLDPRGEVTLVGGAGSHQLVTLAGADLLVVVPVGVAELPAGADVMTIELEETWS